MIQRYRRYPLFSRYIKHLRTLYTNIEVTNESSETVGPPGNARVVVCGGGIMGASVAYHLAKLGWGPETVLLEQSRYELYAYSIIRRILV